MAKRGPKLKGFSPQSGAKPVYVPPTMDNELDALHETENTRTGYAIPRTTFIRRVLCLGMDAMRKGK